MSRKTSNTSGSSSALIVALALTGCQSAGSELLPGLQALLDGKSSVMDEETHRREFQKSRSPKEMNWLLRNSINAGMAVSEVSKVLGEEGRRVYDDGWIKRGGGHYQSGDKAWKWGPDREGRSVFLVFRDGKLVNYDPNEFENDEFGI